MYDYPGAEESGKHDWVEIFNDSSSSVSLSEWRLRENDEDHQINPYPDSASATLSAGAYAVIANNAAAFKIDFPTYTGLLFDSSFSLISGGEMLVMRCCGSNVADRANRDSVLYTPIDSASDQGNTLQRTNSSDATFTSASPTPGTGSLSASGGGGSSSGSDPSPATSTEQNVSASNSSGDSVMPPPPKVFADGGSDRTVIVGADTEFKARAYDERKNLIDFSHFHWNFGDGSVSDVTTVLHRFEYPGRYVVVLNMPEEKDAVGDQIIVTVEPVKLGLSLMQDGGVLIENHAGRTLDLSRWIIRSLGRMFTIPEHTFILAGSPLRISQKTLGFSTGPDIELDYPNGAFALSTVPPPTPTSTPPVEVEVASRAQNPVEDREVESQAFVPEGESIPVEQPEVVGSTTQEESVQAAGVGAALSGSSRVWWFGVIGIAGLAAGSLALARRYGRKEWDIIEENPK